MTKTHTMKPAATVNPNIAELQSIYRDGVKFIDSYFFFSDPNMAKVVTLWAMATWFLQSFDSFGYLAIWAVLKRCGKSRLGESVSYMSRNYNIATDATPAALFGAIDHSGADGTTIMIDEAEKLSNDSNPLREMLNVGCYRGIGVMRSATIEGEKTFERFEVFTPKIFVLIGNIFDTLNDRSISVEMTRMIGQTKKTYLRMIAKNEGEAIGKRMNPMVKFFQSENGEGLMRDTMIKVMTETQDVDSRDLEMWCPVLTMATMIDDGEILTDVLNVAKRLVFAKTAPQKTAKSLKDREALQLIADFAPKCLTDLANHIAGSKLDSIAVADIANVLKASNDHWTLFRGDGVTSEDVASMLHLHGIEQTTIRRKGTNGRSKEDEKSVFKGYKAAAIVAAAKRIGWEK